MDILLLVLGFILIILGILGSLLPVLPGPSLCSIGLLFLYLTDTITINFWALSSSVGIALLLTILDYVLPAQGAKFFGGSSYGIWGVNIGLAVGLIAPVPLGFVIGPLLGAFAGEIIYYKDFNRALKAATGAVLGILTTSILKFIVCIMHLGFFMWVVWKNYNTLF